MTHLWKRPTCTTVMQDIASVYQPHSGLFPPHPPKNTNYSIRCHIPCHVKMSALLLRLATDATVRGTINSDGQQVFSVYNVVNLVCDKRGKFANRIWERLISEDSIYKDELDELFTVEYVNGLIGWSR
jgi:hypothetical protein